ncbi:hypothetical protein HZ992_20865 [Rhizobacter sp. AJA081-3]|uniref:hypothetical protein n=1 Tax=Rhizobacter sp. AJA081-3 TaxID=2753607 RepID=UPI001ADEE307|nr:hypothetical protein [Rhizobacter sp. AJA081-3]QTN22563.1 hypothetical protein HZ992_20865 [Rhizobacter sp. AJA081-3]
MDRIDERRRRFLALAGPGMVLLSTGGLAACGGGGDSAAGDGSAGGGGSGGGSGGGGAPGSGTPGAAVSPALRLATLESTRAAVAGLAAGAARFDSAALALALQALPGLESVGISSRVGNVWARFTDGQYLVVPNNLEPAPATGTAPAAPLRAGGPRKRAAAAGEFDTPAILTGQQYRQVDTFGEVPLSSGVDAAHLCSDWVDANTLPQLRTMALGRGFVLPGAVSGETIDPSLMNGIEGLRTVQGDGVFFLTAQAAQAGPDASPRTLICLDTLASEANLARYETDLKAGIVAHAVRLRGVNGAWEAISGLAIGPDWARLNFWNFPVESVGIFNLTGAPDMSDWVQVLTSAHLRHILVWRSAVPWQRMLAFADDLIQLNLATNKLDGRNVPQKAEPRLRAYGMGETLSHLMSRGLAGEGNASIDYLQEREPALFVNTLLPTIDYVLIKENTLEIELVGQFGHAAAGAPVSRQPSQPETVTMGPQLLAASSDSGRFPEPLLARAADPLLAGAQPLTTPTWEGGLLQGPLRPNELERGGYVQVVNGGRCSNVVPVTHWEIPIQAVLTIDELTLTTTITVRLRADVHGWRLEPDAYARNGIPQGFLTASVHSRADFTASGTISRYDASTRTRTTITWSGSSGMVNQIGAFLVNFSGTVLWDSREVTQVQVALGGAGGATYNQQKVTEQFDVNGDLLRRTEENGALPVSLSAFGPGASGGLLEMRFDDQWNLLAGSFDMLPVNSDILPAPPQRVMRTRLSWPQVVPDFAPRNDFGGT